ncbi:hypothetical protein AY599_06865 [Leptolyngbya valderiana BDU 20041]|uniref:hypothetical protein n=1 Tax=Baaleninema simplex TaxID=2862350 RepID=UPI00034C6C51|nr:hypothetical protein [Baaleninema simplex]MDC0833960.1 hypothetical protein [Geitlerinema sp. CS-897]OAB56672.1 hypothetical protein AY599_06865 [Leptolyngbya valderiana BDU 20041]PPT06763.1 hypothetical protein CKA32_005198 [Geitlerinema sp. FC II]
MTPVLLRQFWLSIEQTQATLLLSLDDASLVRWLTKQLAQNLSLESHDLRVLDTYVRSRIPLIRDLAHQRQESS